jgi:HAD superfamily hydrolase (TIGR01549 family)
MLLRNIKSNIKNTYFNTIIFDLNGTITNSVSKDPRHTMFRNDYIEDKIQLPIHGVLPDETSKALELYMLDTDEYYKYRNGIVDWRTFHSFNETTYNILSRLSSEGYNLVLYTDCYMEQVKPTLQILQIEAFFNLIVSKELGFKKPSTQAYSYIAKKFDVSMDQVLMVANDYGKDLKPLKDIGGNTIWIKSEKQLNKAQRIIKKYAHPFTKNEKALNLVFT